MHMYMRQDVEAYERCFRAKGGRERGEAGFCRWGGEGLKCCHEMVGHGTREWTGRSGGVQSFEGHSSPSPRSLAPPGGPIAAAGGRGAPAADGVRLRAYPRRPGSSPGFRWEVRRGELSDAGGRAHRRDEGGGGDKFHACAISPNEFCSLQLPTWYSASFAVCLSGVLFGGALARVSSAARMGNIFFPENLSSSRPTPTYSHLWPNKKSPAPKSRSK